MAYCDSCDTLKNLSSAFWQNGVTTAVCNSLKNNTGINANLSTPHTNCEDFEYMIDCMIGGITEQLDAYDACDLKDWIRMAMSNLYTLEKAYNCSLCGLWQRLEDLEETVRNLITGTYRYLTYGVDYTGKYYNNWYSLAGYASLSIQESPGVAKFRLNGRSVIDSRFRHNNIFYPNVQQRHTYSVYEVPESRMYAVRFLGNYAKYNNTGNYDIENENGQGIWNLNNSSGQLIGKSFDNVVSLTYNYTDPSDNSNWAFVASVVQASDGYNTQYNAAAGYPNPTVATTTNIATYTSFINKDF